MVTSEGSVSPAPGGRVAAESLAPEEASFAGSPGWRDASRLLRGPLRILVGGQALGQAADGLAQIAFAQLVVFEIGRGATPARVAGVLAATLLPFSVVGPFAGVLIDRWDRRRLLIVVSAFRAGLATAAVGIAVARSLPWAYAGVLLLLSSSRFVLAAKGAVLPRTVAAADLVTANAVSGVAGMMSSFLGAVVGSLFVSWSVPVVFAAAAAGYGAAGLMFRRLPGMGGHAVTAGLASRVRQVAAELTEGALVIGREPEVRWPLLAVWAHRLFLGGGFILLVLVADSRYHLQAPGYGLALAVTGVAALAGTLVAPWLARRWQAQALLPVAFLPPAAAALLTGYLPTLPGLLVALAVTAVSFQCLKVLTDALVGRATDDVVRGRVFAAYDVLYNVAFVLAGLAMVPLWRTGRERPLLWGLATAFTVGWLALARGVSSWPLGTSQVAPRRLERSWRWRAATALAGALPVLAFPAPGWWFLAWVGLVPWLLLVRRAPSVREAAVRGWCGGCGFLFAMHHWLLPSVTVFLPLVVVVLAVLWLPWGAAVWWLLSGRPTRMRAATALVVVPGAWVAVEAVRSWSSLGGPWGLLGASQWRVPALLATASLGGVWLVSYLVVAANVAAVLAIHARRARPRLAAVASVVALVGVGPLWYAIEQPSSGDRQLRIAVVQPGVVPGPEQRFEREEAMTGALAPATYDLVVWGESSVGFDLDTRSDLRARLQHLARRLGSDLLVNVDARDASGAIHKSAVLIGPYGVLGRYEKMRLVPFGEYIPFRRVLGWLTEFTRAAPQNRARGTHLVVLRIDGLAFSPLICFESAFPDMSRVAALDGADLVIVQSATSTFQDSVAPAHHASLAAVRAAETGRPVVHATLTGNSAAFDAWGRRLAWFDTRHRGVVTVSVPLASRRTPFVRYGDWVLAWSFTVLAAAAAFASLSHARVVVAPAPPLSSGG